MRIHDENYRIQNTGLKVKNRGKLVRLPVDSVRISKSKGKPGVDLKIEKLRRMAVENHKKSVDKPVENDGGYAPPGRYLWDSWILKDGENYHLFHLDAPGNVKPEQIHDMARVRHAVSKDLINWKDKGSLFENAPNGSWDDGATWTGNVYKAENGGYLFFYTGRNQRDGQMQRIGLARSKDGKSWDRPDVPLLEPDGRWYETTEPSPIYKAWRDPCVVKDEKTGKHIMYFTAKTKGGDEKYKGCIGIAEADEIDGEYDVKPPVLAPGLYAQIEVPQIVQKNGKVYMFFSSAEKDYNPEWAEKVGGAQSGLHCFVGESLKGPFKPLNGTGIVTGSKDNLYTVKLVSDPDRNGEYVAMGWYMENKNGQKAFTLSKPMKVNWEGDNISIDTGVKE